MTTTLSDGSTTVQLPDDLDWTDEFAWSPISQTTDDSITGALLVQIGTRAAGRPITLLGGEQRAWCKYPVVSQLDAWSHIPGQALTLTIRGSARQVIFRHQEPPAFDAREIWGDIPTLASQDFALTLKLMEI